MKTSWGEFNFVSVDNIQLQEDMIELTNLVCVPRETISIQTAGGKFTGTPSSGNLHVVFPHIITTITDAMQEIPEIRELIAGIMESIKNEERKEEEDEETSGDFAE